MGSTAEMPFLDHLEELRWRIIWSLAAIVVCYVLQIVLGDSFTNEGVNFGPAVFQQGQWWRPVSSSSEGRASVPLSACCGWWSCSTRCATGPGGGG